MIKGFLVSVVGGVILLSSAALAESKDNFTGEVRGKAFEMVRSYFATDDIPLDAEVTGSESVGRVIREQIRLRGFDREWVTGTLARPAGIEKPPVVILLHGLTQSKAQWWRDEGAYSFPSSHRRVLVENGIAVLALDARNHGERMEPKDFKSPYDYVKFQYFGATRKMVAETALDVRRAIDYLETRSDVDVSRLGVAGFSLGAYIGWIATAVDERIDRSLLMALPILPAAKEGRQNFAEPEQFLEGYENRSILLVGATKDTFYTTEQLNSLFERIPTDGKEIVWYDSTHDLPKSSAVVSERYFVGKL